MKQFLLRCEILIAYLAVAEILLRSGWCACLLSSSQCASFIQVPHKMPSIVHTMLRMSVELTSRHTNTDEFHWTNIPSQVLSES
jgi:hypothetical protein